MNLDFLKDAKIIASIFNTFVPNSALIAGGCLRDVVTDRTPKDVDILIQWFDKRDYREIEIIANRLGYDVTNCSDGYEEDQTGALRCVYKLYKVGELPIDVIFLNYSPKERVEQFPCNAAEIWLDGDRLVASAAFNDFLVTKKLLFTVNCPDGYKERLLGYYPQ